MTLLWKYNPFMFSISKPVLYKDITFTYKAVSASAFQYSHESS